MGVVYKAQDTKLDRPVALKFFPPDLCTDLERKSRFVKEAKIASSIDHPNVVAIYEIDEAANDNLYIAMAYYRGETLDAKIKKGPLNLSEAVGIALQIARGLAKAHELGIIHQDIKPSNILITSDGVAKILDFGVATLNEPSVDYRTGTSLAGTLPYMSPEQIQGEPTDFRTDIWSLGVVLYEMLSGRLPFSGQYEQAIRYSILNEKYAPIDSLPSHISSDLQFLLDKALQRKPADRFQRADELIPLLQTIKVRNESIVGDRRPAIAVLPFVDLSPQHDQEYFCDGLAEELITALAKVDGLRTTSRISSFQFKGKAVDIRHIGEQLNVKTVVEGSVRKSGDNLRITAQLVDVSNGYQLWSERFDRKLLDVFAIQEETAQKIVQTLKIKLLPGLSGRLVKRSTDNLAAYNLYLEGRYYWNKRTAEGLLKSIELFQHAVEKDPQYALAYTGIADAYSLMDQYGTLPLRESVQRAEAAAKKALELDDQLAEAHASAAQVEVSYNWNYVEAEKQLRQAILLNPNYATAHHWLAFCLTPVGAHDEALREITKALELDPLSLILNRDKGIILYYARQYDQAIAQANKVLEMDPNFALAHRLLAIAYERKGLYAESLKENRIWGDLTKDDLRTQAALGHVYAVSGQKNEAMKIVQRLEKEIPSRKDLTSTVGLIYTSLGEIDRAFEWLDKAFENHSGPLGMLKVDPKWDTLRSDPRFVSLLKKMKLDQQ